MPLFGRKTTDPFKDAYLAAKKAADAANFEEAHRLVRELQSMKGCTEAYSMLAEDLLSPWVRAKMDALEALINDGKLERSTKVEALRGFLELFPKEAWATRRLMELTASSASLSPSS